MTEKYSKIDNGDVDRELNAADVVVESTKSTSNDKTERSEKKNETKMFESLDNKNVKINERVVESVKSKT